MTEPKANGAAGLTSHRPKLEPITIDGDYPDIPNTCSPTAVSPATGGMDSFDEIIPDPDEVHHRNLILCFDGTGDQFDTDVEIFLNSICHKLSYDSPSRTPILSPSSRC